MRRLRSCKRQIPNKQTFGNPVTHFCNDKTAPHSHADKWVLPPASTKVPEEREFVVESGACMHTVSKKDLNSDALDIMKISRILRRFLTANGEAETREEATENVRELDLIETVLLLEETPAVLSLVKLCEDHGYPSHWSSGQKPHLTRKGKRIDCNKSNDVPFAVFGLSSSSSATPTPTSSTSSSQDFVFDESRYTENTVPERIENTSEESRSYLQHSPEQTEKWRTRRSTMQSVA